MVHDNTVSPPSLTWRDGAPVSDAFDDIYFSGDGADETTHVFLHGNALPERWQNAPRFTIGELGFGTGLNFLVAADAWRRTEKPQDARLNFLSFEAFPLSPADMARAHAAWPQYSELAAPLRAALPAPQPGFHRCQVTPDICLTLFYGDALVGLNGANAAIDAWFFDGFAPAKNPAMWSPEIFKCAANLTAPEGTFATFTVAGAVRRAAQEAGFEIEKRPGHGRKREMLTGKIARPAPSPNLAPNCSPRRAPWFDTQTPPLASAARVAIIGGGIAGASAAHELALAGLQPTIFDAHGLASGASGNPAGLIMPRLDADDTPIARFFTSAYLHALRMMEKMAATGHDVFNPCGALLHYTNEKEQAKQEKILAMRVLPDGFIKRRDEGLFFPHGAASLTPPHMSRRFPGKHRCGPNVSVASNQRAMAGAFSLSCQQISLMR